MYIWLSLYFIFDIVSVKIWLNVNKCYQFWSLVKCAFSCLLLSHKRNLPLEHAIIMPIAYSTSKWEQNKTIFQTCTERTLIKKLIYMLPNYTVKCPTQNVQNQRPNTGYKSIFFKYILTYSSFDQLKKSKTIPNIIYMLLTNSRTWKQFEFWCVHNFDQSKKKTRKQFEILVSK